MLYIKPEVVKLSNAVEAIQGVSKNSINADSGPLVSAAAYEADE